MTVGRALYNMLNNDAGIHAVVLGKIFPEIAPANLAAPYIVYSVVSNAPSDIKEDGGSVDTAQIEVYCFETTYSKAIDLGVLVRGVLDRVNGTFSGVEIQSIKYNNEQMDVTPERDLWASIQDYEARIKL